MSQQQQQQLNKAGYMTNVRLEDTMLCISAIHFR